jgi:hypothetical protein
VTRQEARNSPVMGSRRRSHTVNFLINVSLGVVAQLQPTAVRFHITKASIPRSCRPWYAGSCGKRLPPGLTGVTCTRSATKTKEGAPCPFCGQETIARLAEDAIDLGHVQFHPLEDLADPINLISLNFLRGGFESFNACYSLVTDGEDPEPLEA